LVFGSVFFPAVRVHGTSPSPETEVRRPGTAKVETATAVPSAQPVDSPISGAIGGCVSNARSQNRAWLTLLSSTGLNALR